MPIKGTIVPNMGTKKSENNTPAAQSQPTSLGGALFTTTQQRILGYLFGQPSRSFFGNELIQLTGSGSGGVQRELKRLVESGLVTVRQIGNQKHYQANPAAPIFSELCGIVKKTFGLATPLREALAPLDDQIKAAFIFGSIAKRADTAESDIDLLILTDTLSYADVMAILGTPEEQLKRKINPTLYSFKDLQTRLREDNAFVARILQQPKIWLKGDEYDLPT